MDIYVDANGVFWDVPSTGTLGIDLAAAMNALRAPKASVPLVDGASIAVDASLGTSFSVTLGGARAFANPSNLSADNQELWLWIKQDATGTRIPTFGTVYDFGVAGVPTFSTGANKVDALQFRYNAGLSKLCMIKAALGF